MRFVGGFAHLAFTGHVSVNPIAPLPGVIE